MIPHLDVEKPLYPKARNYWHQEEDKKLWSIFKRQSRSLLAWYSKLSRYLITCIFIHTMADLSPPCIYPYRFSRISGSRMSSHPMKQMPNWHTWSTPTRWMLFLPRIPTCLFLVVIRSSSRWMHRDMEWWFVDKTWRTPLKLTWGDGTWQRYDTCVFSPVAIICHHCLASVWRLHTSC